MIKNRKNIALLAAAVITTSLISGQAYPVTADYQTSSSSSIKKSSLIPDNVTIQEPMALSDISLPSSDYGTLSWVNEDYVPQKRVQSCRVEFKPYDSVDVSYMSGWDEEDGVLRGRVTVVVSSLDGDDSDDYEYDDYNEEYDDYDSDDYDGEYDDYDGGDYDEAYNDSGAEDITPEGESGENTENGSDEEGESTAEGAECTEQPEQTEGEDASSAEAEETLAADSVPAETVVPAENQVDASAPAAEGETTTEPAAEEIASAEGDASAETDTEGNTSVETDAGVEGTETVVPDADTGEVLTPSAGEETSAESGAQDSQKDNIFDKEETEEPDERSQEAEEELTPEEQAERAAENHTCGEISVSGISLPWYVQFRATATDSYQFSNEDGASIFRSYEFQLWDLKNDVEYEIPDGQYISVIVPVKEGYEYTIEHLLDNGAVERIVPSVEGSTMIFSTHSFSPFGIAGSKTLIGENIAQESYAGGTGTISATPTSAVVTPTKAAAATGTSSGGTVSGQGSTSSGSSSAQGTGQSSVESSQTGSQSTGTTVNTGDDTPIGTFVILVVAAVCVIFAVVLAKKRKK